MRSPRLLRAAWFAVLSIVVIGSLLPSSSPALQLIDRLELSDLILHSFSYLLLTLLSILNFSVYWQVKLIATATFLLSFAIECLQTKVPGRTFEWYDLAANLVGTIAGWVSWRVVRGILK
jgi:VanZ family protein